MVNVMKGILVKCDPAMKQFLLHLDETIKLGRKFIIQDLDESHLFISSDILDTLQAKIDDLMDQISFPIMEKTIN
ncbi:PREDICTED: general transcription factor IIH subunit 5 [Nicrophorus vespilloides]|uniref:General transcription and DNA repair factor IIH subunit TFB5 n=1 Tax=Nicrophorus vespilloides TaxID=110193 RepID=A0ABM1MSM0_NICVS|nr:PREDICTED: general transcription factor IIH subunit 5 [Nicrophorus vespilloides]